MTKPLISVVIPTQGDAASVLAALGCLESQVGIVPSEVEVVIVLDGRNRPLQLQLEGHHGRYSLRVLERPRGGTAAAWQAGWLAAQAPIVLFLTDSLRPSPGLLAAHLRAHRGEHQRVVLGALRRDRGNPSAIDAYEDRMSSKKQSRLRAHERPAGIHDARNVSVPAAALSAVGGFDVWLPVDADVHLGERLRLAGLEFVYEPAAEAQDTGVTTFGEWRLRYVVQGRLAVDLYARRSSGSLDALVACFHDRHPANRLAVRYALGGRERQAHIETLLARAGELAHQARLRRMSLAALSMLANVAYWSGVRDGLRGSAEFWRLVRSTRGFRGRPYELVAGRR